MLLKLWKHYLYFQCKYLLIIFDSQKVSSILQITQLKANKSNNILLSLLNNDTLLHYDFLFLTEH